ncbi:zinc finger CCCH domain-containing protein 10-like [Sitophilus oryzae]|uniref:Zinc finger CCCH domain-containing protein 10-like n=1 Tax=Sitophilus oryzae TaxID=7048 RepID=A0A6J2XUY3_SITOR|nr:zinc finger CCCH domain-containing protein 10-like [Sitophilus oryzae]
MSDTSSEDALQSDRQSDKEDSVCRDFVRGICDRQFCKYKHENEIRPLNFCYDFQNNICPRPHCKFIHCSPDEVEEYKRSGEMSNQILAEATRKSQLPGTPPVCNQFKKGICRRAHCKFRHITKEQEEKEIMDLIHNNVQRKKGNTIQESQFYSSGGFLSRRNGIDFSEYSESGLPLAKRRFIAAEEMLNRELQLEADRIRPVFKGYFAGTPPPGVLDRVDARNLILEEENNLLHKEIAQLKKQVQDLTATNEFLLDQNANLRVTNKQNSVNMPAVTLTNTNTQPQMIRTVTASVATVPVSLATVTTGNPVSGNPVSIAGCPTVSIASPAQILAPSQQILVTTNPGQQLALATSTQQAQHMANQQLALANASQQLNSQPQQITLTSNPQTHQQLTSQAQQLALANTTQQLTSQAQQLALANTTQQLTSQAQQLALASAPQQLTSQAQQLALANTTQQLTVTNVPPQQLTLANTNQQLLAAQQNLAASTQQIEQMHRNNQINAAINTSQAIAMSNASQPMVSYPIMTQSLNHPLAH